MSYCFGQAQPVIVTLLDSPTEYHTDLLQHLLKY